MHAHDVNSLPICPGLALGGYGTYQYTIYVVDTTFMFAICIFNKGNDVMMFD